MKQIVVVCCSIKIEFGGKFYFFFISFSFFLHDMMLTTRWIPIKREKYFFFCIPLTLDESCRSPVFPMDIELNTNYGSFWKCIFIFEKFSVHWSQWIFQQIFTNFIENLNFYFSFRISTQLTMFLKWKERKKPMKFETT